MVQPDLSNESPAGNYKKPSLAVDAILMSVYRGRLSVVLDLNTDASWSLPGTFVHEGETLVAALNRGLTQKLELSPISTFRQLQVFDAPNRDPRGWAFSVAHYALVHEDLLEGIRPKQVMPIENARDLKLAFDHSDMLALAITRLREEYSEKPDPWNILGRFTLSDLRRFHESIDPSTYLRDTFRRVMEPQLVETADAPARVSTVGRPPRIWRNATPEEQILRKFADRDKVQVKRARLAPTSSRQEQNLRPSARKVETAVAEEFSVEFVWSKTGSVVHDHLREREAYKLLEEFLLDATETSGVPKMSGNVPIEVIMRDEFGNVMRRQKV
jgi:ADP-ribose pyrophosphatase YjhB (NUDIX family)